MVPLFPPPALFPPLHSDAKRVSLCETEKRLLKTLPAMVHPSSEQDAKTQLVVKRHFQVSMSSWAKRSPNVGQLCRIGNDDSYS